MPLLSPHHKVEALRDDDVRLSLFLKVTDNKFIMSVRLFVRSSVGSTE